MNENNPAYQLMTAFYGFMISESLYVAAELGIADQLAKEPQDLHTLAKNVHANTDALERIMRLLVQKEIFSLNDDGKYQINNVSQLLRSDVPGSLQKHFQFRDIPRLNAYRELLYSVKTGEPAFDHIYSMDYFSYLSKHPDLAHAFDNFMSATTEAEVVYISKEFDFSKYSTIADVGGNKGVLLAQILKDYPKVYGILVDLPEAIANASYLKKSEFVNRSELIAQSFFDGIPAGKDLYILKQVLHDWDDKKILLILKNLKKAMKPNSHFLIIEPLKTEKDQSLLENEVDLCLLTFLGGRRRSEQEFSDLLNQAELKIDKITKSKALPTSYLLGSIKK